MLRVTVNSFDEARNCPFRSVLDKLGDKWSFLLFATLEDGPKRFNEIKRLLGDISQRVLASKLRDLERDGYVNRRVHAASPLRVEYSLTPLGQSALEPISELMHWAVGTHSAVTSARARYDRSRAAKSA